MFVENHLAMMYGNCGDMHEANMVFQKLSQWNVFSWTIMLGIYCRHGLARDAVELFHRMQLDGVIPDKPAFVTIVNACTRFWNLAKGKFFHAYIIISDFDSYEIVGNAILNIYSKLGGLEYVESFFCRMRNKDIVSWTSMIVFYSETGNGRKALSYFHEMQPEGILPDKVTYSSVVEACISEEALAQGKRIHSCIRKSGLHSCIVLATALMNLYNICGWSEEGHRIFDKMQERNLVSWNSILSSFCWQGNPKETLHILLEMEAEGLMPNNVTCVGVVGMFANTEVLSGTK